MQDAEFELYPYRPPDGSLTALFTNEKLTYAHQPVPEEYQKSLHQTLDRFLDFDLQSKRSAAVSHGYNTRVNAPAAQNSRDDIQYHAANQLGEGTQGTVSIVIDLFTDDLYARKLMPYTRNTLWGHLSQSEFKRRVSQEVELVKSKQHVCRPIKHITMLNNAYLVSYRSLYILARL